MDAYETIRDPKSLKHREAMRNEVRKHLRSHITEEELDIHFSNMPERYWNKVSLEDLLWHIEMHHQFMIRVLTPEHTRPLIQWRHDSDSDLTEVIVIAWNRHGLLAKIAGAFCSAGMSVNRADVYTRRDNMILDVFYVEDAKGGRIKDLSLIEKVVALIDEAIMKHGDLPLDHDDSGEALEIEEVTFDQSESDLATVIKVRAKDQVGLLHDLLQILALCELDIVEAKIQTQDHMAEDFFYVTNRKGARITQESQLDQIRSQLMALNSKS